VSGRLTLGSKAAEKTDNFARQTVELPRSTKRVIAIFADAVMMPLMLWATSGLKQGYPTFNISDWPAYLAVVAISIPIFVRLGLYRAVIRFLGYKAVFAVAFAMALSGALLGILGFALKIPLLAWSVVTIYSCLSLL
jgi:FlaA1/EpsC-like NDP-sugar epimerase